MTRLMQRFCAERVRLGGSTGAGWRAAKAAGYAGDEKTLAVRASKLMRDRRVKARIAQLRAEGAEIAEREGVAVMKLARKLEILAKIAEDGEAKDADRVRAIELAARLDGDWGRAGAGDDPGDAKDASAVQVQIVNWVGNGRGPAPEVVGGG